MSEKPEKPEKPKQIRYAECAYGCGKIQPSDPSLAFFKERPDREYDTYYCGCFGFD